MDDFSKCNNRVKLPAMQDNHPIMKTHSTWKKTSVDVWLRDEGAPPGSQLFQQQYHNRNFRNT